MKTTQLIKKQALEMFNQMGLTNVTLRHVAEALNKSYGNITYHYKTKENLVTELYHEMNTELSEIPGKITSNQEFLVFELTKFSYATSIKYVFFLLDYMELKRNYTSLMKRADKDNAIRMKQYKLLLTELQKNGILRTELDSSTIDYLMELSGATRTFYFQKHYDQKTARSDYIVYVNQLLFPYLSPKGIHLLKNWEKENTT